jgi:hypothetical protein
MWHVWSREQVPAGFWWGNLREEDLGFSDGIILDCILKK